MHPTWIIECIEAGADDYLFKPFNPVLLQARIKAGIERKRWHDRDKSGWWALLNLIPVIGTLWILIECGFLRGTYGGNRFGPDPLGPPEQPA